MWTISPHWIWTIWTAGIRVYLRLALHPRCSGPDGKFRKTAPTFRFNQENLSQTKGGSRQIETENKKKTQQKLKKRYISVVLSENVSFLSWLLWMLHRIEMATFAGDCGQCVSSRGVWREEKQNRLLDLELIIGIRWKLHWERGRCSSLQNNPTSIWYKKENPKLKEREREREREKRDKRTNNNIFRVWSWIYFLPVSSTRSSRKMATRNGTGNHPPKINNNNIDNDINWC